MAARVRCWAAALGTGLAAALTVCLWLGGAVGSAAPVAHASKRFTENVSVHLVKKKGPILKERGTATGTLSGSVRARFDTSDILKTTGRVTFFPNGGGSLTIIVLGAPESLATVAKVSGNLGVRSGTGRYAHATGSGTFRGTLNRSTWAITVHVKGTLNY